MAINLHIERLVLDGVDMNSNQSEVLQAKVSTELTQLLSNGGIAPNLINGVSLKSVSTSNIQINDTRSQVLGQQIAQSVYGGIGRE